MRKALVIGINAYTCFPPLSGCVGDARSIQALLERNADGSKNFAVRTLLAEDDTSGLDQSTLRDAIQNLFASRGSASVFYFAGHGYVDPTGGYLATSESRSFGQGISLNDIFLLAVQSPAANKLIILDSCHSGAVGQIPISPGVSNIGEGMTVLAASGPTETAKEIGSGGVFTSLLIDALSGAAANLIGDISPGSVYAHIDEALGPWDQRPVFKANVSEFLSLRRVEPAVAPEDLRRITQLFPNADSAFVLDPSFEPERSGAEPEDTPAPDIENVRTFSVLQRFSKLNLVVPVDAPFMWHAAMQRRSCRLTSLGKHYHRLVSTGRF